jgi:hypothetical protein
LQITTTYATLRDGGKLLSSRSFAARLKELLARSR